jgi:hypothetical protein
MRDNREPISFIVVPDDIPELAIGNDLDIFVTISNRGTQSAFIDVYIDESSQPPYLWFKSKREHLALGPNQNIDISFKVQVPADATPGDYKYTIIVDAPRHYPEDTPISQTHRLRVVLPPDKGPGPLDPTLTLDPDSNDLQPLVYTNRTLVIQAVVLNRTQRVDRFRLICPDLEDEWYDVTYPPRPPGGAGLLTPGIGLELNPGEEGRIRLTIHPNPQAPAGVYSPTVQLLCANLPTLQLIRLLYVQIPPVYTLKVDMSTLRAKAAGSREPGRYEVRLTNAGNVLRDLRLGAIGDEANLCECSVKPEKVRLLIGKKETAEVQVQPRPWWRRPWWGRGVDIPFRLSIEDTQGLPLPEEMPLATLTWQPRPWWQLLPVVLLILLVLALIALLVLSWLRPPTPLAVDFKTDTVSYTEGDRVRLKWKILHIAQLDHVVVIALDSNSTLTSQPVTYNLSKGLPPELAERCLTNDETLECNGVPTDVRRAGKYSFQLQVFAHDNSDTPISTGTSLPFEIKLKPMPPLLPPHIFSFEINGKEAPPKIAIEINNPKKTTRDLIIHWQVQGSSLSVELLPAPGSVAPSGTRSYTPSKLQGSETLTIKAVNPAGQITRSVTIETYNYVPPPSPPGTLSTPQTNNTPIPLPKVLHPVPAVN